MKHIPFIFLFFLSSYSFCQKTNAAKTKDKATQQKAIVQSGSKYIQRSAWDSLHALKDTVTYSEIIMLRKLDFISGSIYFSGTYYPNVAILRLYQNSNSEFNKYFDRCAPGSKINFENVYWKDENGKISNPFSKMFTLQ